MALAENKTQKTAASVADFLAKVQDPERRADCKTLAKLMKAATGKPGKLWGTSIVGFGDVIVKGKSREVAWFQVGFSPRKGDLSVYLMELDPLAAELAKLGKHTRGRGCLYLKRLADVDVKVLEKMIRKAAARHG